MQKNFLYSFLRGDILLPIIVIVMSSALGILVTVNLKAVVVLLCLLLLLVILRYFGIIGILYVYALFWWIPVGVGSFITADLLGGYIAELAVLEILAYGGAFIVWLSRLLANRKFHEMRFQPDLVWVFLILMLVGGLIASTEITKIMGFVMFRRSTFFFAAMIFLCANTLKNKDVILRVLFFLLIGGCLFLGFVLVARLLPGVLFMDASWINSTRLGGNYAIPLLGTYYFGPNNLGLIAGMQIALATSLLFLETTLLRRLIVSVALIGNIVILFSSGSRGGLISTGIVVIFMLFCFLRMRKKNGTLILLLVVGIGMALILPAFVTTEISERFQSLTSISGLENDSSVKVRLELFKKVLEIFWDKPFGIGYAMFVTRTDNFILWEQNLFLNTLMGGGFLGFIGLSGFFILLFGRGTIKFIMTSTQDRLFLLALLSPSLVFFINTLASDPNSETSIFLSWLILGVSYAGVLLPRAK